MLFQVLRPLERLAAEAAFMRLERDVNQDVRDDVVALGRGRVADIPLARQVQVVCALAADMPLAEVVLHPGVSTR